MAVPGRTQRDMRGLIATGSAEDFDNTCESCLTIGQHIEARGFCVQCQEYLCKTCLDCHRRMKLSRSHQILERHEFDKPQTTRESYNECLEQCPLHQKEIIKFYCPKHAYLDCSDCMTIDHRTCKIDYIPEKCVGIAGGNEYKDIMLKLSEKLKEAEEVSKKAESSNSDINDISKEVIKKIEEFRAEINDRLDQMQQDILSNVEGKKSNNKEKVKNIIDTCRNIISDVQKLQSSLRANKSNNQNGQLYIDIKRAECVLKPDELTEAKEKILNMNIQCTFRRGADLERLLSKETVFGVLITHAYPDISKMVNTLDQLTMKNDIYVKTKSDKDVCHFTSCAVLASNKLVLADWKNGIIKVVSLGNGRVLEEKVLDSIPCGIAVMSHNQFSVTMPTKGKIDFMKTDDKLSIVRSINVGRKCYGIAFHQDLLYVACMNPHLVVVLTTQGSVLNKIPLDFLTRYIPHIAVRKVSNLLYVSDTVNNRVVGVSLQGDVSAIYKHEDLQEPRAMCLLDDGSLLVCCFGNGTIHQVKGDLKGGKTMHDGIARPNAIFYSEQNGEVYVGCHGNNVKVLSSK